MDKDSLEDLSLKEDKKIIIRRNLEMEMCYDGALVMPSSYAVMNEEEMTYVEGGGTFFVKVGSNSFVMTALATIAGSMTTAKAVAVLGASCIL